MDDDIRAFGETIGRKALARDWSAVHQLLASWLRATISLEGVRSFFEDEYRSTLAANGVEDLQYPEYLEPEVGGNNYMNATKLREPIEFEGGKVRPVPPEVTDQNMRFWMVLRLQCSDEQMEKLSFDTFCEVWIAVVETSEGLRVGYWSQGAY
ncbi:MAG: hypothetical protein J0L70_13515 [Leptolyngbya sp. UWPOB_LEPTO1]|uniref:hypothetical protein n=1 Tax=Leptolyngbya sp. UWPOB_LEPTO1 TaxID=2815653 RepID=UPI001AC72A78|nr:hypothetical protein [Leptolyngbya sp. UWPOB_LEPTO1]MBN8561543.1 hypothetical protein [Leptolyngbya sp. UWPOB_LEPTO1]